MVGGLDSEISDLATVSSWGVISQPHAVRPSGNLSSLLHRVSSIISLVAAQGGGHRHNEKSRNLSALIRRVAAVLGREAGQPAAPAVTYAHLFKNTTKCHQRSSSSPLLYHALRRWLMSLFF